MGHRRRPGLRLLRGGWRSARTRSARRRCVGDENAARPGGRDAIRGGAGRARDRHGPQTGYHNYFLGADPARWAAHVPLYDEVVLEDLYDGVDLRLYDDGGLPRYDLTLAPGADLAQVRVRLDGADSVTLTTEGALRMDTSLGPVEQRGLLAYQQAGGTRQQVPSAFQLKADGTLGFAASGADPTRPLVVDPVLWSTFLGGNFYDVATAVAGGPGEEVTVVGYAERADFPTTPGAYDRDFGGLTDAFVSRLSTDGSALLYSTYLGGTEFDIPNAVVVTSNGSATVSGSTSSVTFPTTPGALDTRFNGDRDAFVTRLAADGSALLYSTFLGGTSSDYGYAVAVGADGLVTVAGGTYSQDFPTTPGAFDTSYNNRAQFGTDAFVVRLSADGGALHYGTYLGGLEPDYGYAVAVGPDGTATIAGATESADFPTTPGAFDTSYNGADFGGDAFLTRLSADGSTLRHSTFVGGTRNDVATAVALGSDGAATIAGFTASLDFPTTRGAYDTTQNDHREFASDGFVAQLSPDGASLRYSTYLGGKQKDSVADVAVCADGEVLVVGSTRSSNFPTPGGYDTIYNGRIDAFVARLSADGSSLRDSTFLGGTDQDYAVAVATSPDGSASVAGYTRSREFPVTPGAYDTVSGRYDAFVPKVGVSA